MDKQLLQRLAHRPTNANKYDFGHVLVIGGSPGMVGAPLLASLAALRVGAGLVTVASRATTARQLEKRVKEVMTLALPPYDRTEEATRAVLEFAAARKVTSVVIGPGLPRMAESLVRTLLARLPLPAVLDAGGLTAFRGHLELLQKTTVRNPGVIITPHSGEFDRLTNNTFNDDSERRRYAQRFAAQYRLTVVLKGHHTLVAHPNGSSYVNQTGNPGLATAGTGDVLAGVIAGLLAQRFEPAQAAEAGVYLHGLAGDVAAAEKTEAGLIASDLIDLLPAALKEALR